MVPDVISAETRARLLAPEIMGPPIVWLASEEAKGVHNERIVAKDFDDWLTHRRAAQA
jgi:gluconate 5-dehydrogenase